MLVMKSYNQKGQIILYAFVPARNTKYPYERIRFFILLQPLTEQPLLLLAVLFPQALHHDIF